MPILPETSRGLLVRSPAPLLLLALSTLVLTSASGQVVMQTVANYTQNDVYGKALAPAGDVDGDGVDDFLVGFPDHANGHGRVEVRSGRTGFKIRVFSGTPGARLGTAVAGVGDVTGDGLAEVAFSAPGESFVSGPVTLYDPVRVFDVATLSYVVIHWSSTDDEQGASLAGGGDGDGDGWPELLMGCPEADPGGLVDAGTVSILRMTPGGPSTTVLRQGDQAGQGMGHSVAWVGDVDGDGRDDLAVGSPYRDEIGLPGGADVGRVHVLAADDGALHWSNKGPTVPAGGRFAWSVSGGFDLTGDGAPDVVVGAPWYDDGRGRVTVYHGPNGAFHAARTGDAAGDWLGWDVTSIRFEGDTYVLAGAPGDGSPSPDPGVVYRLARTDLSTTWSDTGDMADGQLGLQVANLGDINGDGSDEWAASQPFPNVFATDEHGRVSMYDGVTHLAAWTTVGPGLAGTNGVPAMTPDSLPTLNHLILVHLGNSAPGPTTAAVFLGLTPAALPFKGGQLHLQPLVTQVFGGLPLEGLDLPLSVGLDHTLMGARLYAQAALADPGAVFGVSLTPAVRFDVGV